MPANCFTEDYQINNSEINVWLIFFINSEKKSPAKSGPFLLLLKNEQAGFGE